MTDLELSQARLAKIIGSNSVYVGAVLNGSTLKTTSKKKMIAWYNGEFD